MAGWTTGQLLLLGTLIAAAFFSCSASRYGQPHSEGIRVQVAASRKLLSQSTAAIMTYLPKPDQTSLTFVEDYPGVSVHPPTNDDYPPPPFFNANEDISGDYGPPSSNPPIHVDPPAPGLPTVIQDFQVENSKVDFPPPNSVKVVDVQNVETHLGINDFAAHADYASAQASSPDVDHDYPPPVLTNLNIDTFTTDYPSTGANSPNVDHDYPPPPLLV